MDRCDACAAIVETAWDLQHKLEQAVGVLGAAIDDASRFRASCGEPQRGWPPGVDPAFNLEWFNALAPRAAGPIRACLMELVRLLRQDAHAAGFAEHVREFGDAILAEMSGVQERVSAGEADNADARALAACLTGYTRCDGDRPGLLDQVISPMRALASCPHRAPDPTAGPDEPNPGTIPRVVLDALRGARGAFVSQRALIAALAGRGGEDPGKTVRGVIAKLRKEHRWTAIETAPRESADQGWRLPVAE